MGAQNKPMNIVIVGATGNVGRKIVDVILQRKIAPAAQLILLASKKSRGISLTVDDKTLEILDADDYDFSTENIYLFATESNISKAYISRITSNKSFIIDSSSLYRLDADTPLIVAPVNRSLISISDTNRYAIANCVASPLCVVLAPLHEIYSIKSLHISTYQSVSGAGKHAMDELTVETDHVREGKPYPRKHFTRQIAFNVIPQIGTILPDGNTTEEQKIMLEIQKILAVDVPICVTAVRVPAYIGHSCSVSVAFEHPFEIDDIRKQFHRSAGIKLSERDYTTPAEIIGSDDVHVGRLRRDFTNTNGLAIWTCSDNLRRGAALDAAEVAEEIINQLNNTSKA